MRKEITVVKYIDVCDFCGVEEDHDNCWIYSCEICDKQICEKCAKWIRDAELGIDAIHVCTDCAKKDFTEYKRLASIKTKLYKQIDELSTKQDKILEEMKEGTV